MERPTTGTDASGGPSVVAVFLAQARGTPMKRVVQARAIAGRGLDGCRHASPPKKPGGKRQVLLMDERHARELALPLGALKENLVLRGVELETLPAGQRLRVGDAVLELTGPCVPCHKLDRIRPGLLSESWGRRGQLARVLHDGVIREGDGVQLLDVNPYAEKPLPTPKLP